MPLQGTLQRLACIMAHDVSKLKAFFRCIPHQSIRAELWNAVNQDAGTRPAWLRDALVAKFIFPVLVNSLSIRAFRILCYHSLTLSAQSDWQ